MYKVILKKNIKYLVLGVILSILSSALYVFAGYSLTYLFNSYNQGAQITKIILNGVSVLAVWGVTLLMMYIYNVFQQKIICRMKTDLREMMAQKIISIDYGEFSDKDTGNYVSWMTNDVEQISKDAFSNFFVIIDSIAQTIFSLFALFYLGIGIGVMAIVLFLLMVAIPQLASIGLEKKSELMSKSNEEATEKYKENIGGFIIFYLANRSNYFVDKIKEISYLQEKAIFAKEKKTVFVEIIGASVSLFCQISLIVITIFMASLGLTPIGAVLAVGNLSQTFFSNVSSSIESIIKSRTTKKMWEKYSYDSDKCDRQKKITAINQIVVDKMNFAYDENYIIKDFSVVLEKGKKYALLGESGSGKTTFAKVLAGLLDNYSGNVFFDKIELKEIQRHSLFNQITYVDQNVYVFAESIRFNISLGENFSDEEIWEALRKSQLDEFVNRLDGKLEYKLSENGKNLSGGQRQRLALARAFIRNVSFVIIDEGTSALDMKNATEIENTLMAEPDTGMIIISHNLSEETKKKIDNVISF